MAATAPSYVIRYFDTLGLAETSRYLLTAAKVNWTEENPEWPQEKPNQPFGRLPVLVETSPEGDEPFILSESVTIERYLARKYGFLPVDDYKASARQEQIRDQETDIVLAFFRLHGTVGDAKKELTEKFHDLVDKLIEVLTKALKENGNNGYFVANKISYLDIATYAFFRVFFISVKKLREDISDEVKAKLTPEITKLIVNIEGHPALAARVSKVDKLTALLAQ